MGLKAFTIIWIKQSKRDNTTASIKYLLLISDDDTLLIRKIVNNNEEVICRLDEDEYDLVYNEFVLKNSKEG